MEGTTFRLLTFWLTALIYCETVVWAQLPPSVGPACESFPAEVQRCFEESLDPNRDFAREVEPEFTFGETLYKSLIGPQPDPDRIWTPLTLECLSDGWLDPWIAPPAPSGGSRRQGWVSSNDAFFNRMIVGIDSFTPHRSGGGNEQVATMLFETPITRRYMFGVFMPFLDSVQGEPAPQQTVFSDATFENRFLLHETQNTSISLNLNVQTPTGTTALGAHRTILNSYVAFFRDVGNGFSIRGLGGVNTPLDSRPDGVSCRLNGQFGIGQTLTPHDLPWFGDFTYYFVTNLQQPVDQGVAYVSITPGLRTHLGRNFWLLGGVDVPLNHPDPFDERFTLVLVKGY